MVQDLCNIYNNKTGFILQNLLKVYILKQGLYKVYYIKKGL